jgi:hypothetical protein
MDAFVSSLDFGGLRFPLGSSSLTSTRSLTLDRGAIWKAVVNRMADEQLALPCSEEKTQLRRLATTGVKWLEMVPAEWREIYSAIFDEATEGSFAVPDSEITKIEKDVHRTFGLFARNISSVKITSRLEKSLQTVLLAASHECGYCQGTW